MEKIKANFSITYTTGTHIEFTALFDTVRSYAEVVRKMEDYMDNPSSFAYSSIRLAPYNEDINAELLTTDILLSLDDLLYIQTSCEVIRYEVIRCEEPRI